MKLVFDTGTAIEAMEVEELLVTATSKQTMDQFHHIMARKYKIKRLGRPTRFLGWYFNYGPDGTIALSQRLLVDNTLADADMVQINGKRTLYSKDEKYHAPSETEIMLPEKASQYKTIIGDLRYLADCTRPDLTYVVGRLGAAMDKPTARHWKILKSVLRYISPTRNHTLIFRKKNENDKVVVGVKTRRITERSDAYWDNDEQDRKSATGGFITYQGMPAAWISRKQLAVSM